jgi:hypothetical protein
VAEGYQGKGGMAAGKGGHTAASRSQPCAWRHALQIGLGGVSRIATECSAEQVCFVCCRWSMARSEALEEEECC